MEITARDHKRLEKMLRKDERGRKPIVNKRRPTPSGGGAKIVKAQTDGEGTASTISVKRLDANGNETGTAFNVYVSLDCSEIDLDAHWPKIVTTKPIAIERIGGKWHLAKALENVGKW